MLGALSVCVWMIFAIALIVTWRCFRGVRALIHGTFEQRNYRLSDVGIANHLEKVMTTENKIEEGYCSLIILSVVSIGMLLAACAVTCFWWVAN
jgi:hypothetical protein